MNDPVEGVHAQTGDGELAVAAQAGNRDAWSALCHRHAGRLAAYLGSRLRRPKVVEKLVEEAIVAAWLHLHQLEQPAEFAAWFRRIGADLALRWYREHKDEKLSEAFPLERCGGDQERITRMARAEAALGTLADAQRMALEQRFRGGMRGQQLGESLRLDAAAVDRLLDEALLAFERAFTISERAPAREPKA